MPNGANTGLLASAPLVIVISDLGDRVWGRRHEVGGSRSGQSAATTPRIAGGDGTSTVRCHAS
jgi:hypothetical protein